MDCSAILRRYSRYILILFNLLFVLTGAVILSVGVSVKAYYHEYDAFLDAKYIYASDLLIAIGVIIFLIAFFGCCGALKENACMTLTFSILLVIILILELIVGIGGILLRNKTENMISKALHDSMDRYNTDNETTFLWDQIQNNFNCCGVSNYTDWQDATNSTNHLLPISCCKIKTGSLDSVQCRANSPTLHTEGCLEAFSDYIEGHAASIEGVGIGFAILQLLGIVLSCYLSKQIKSDYETV